MHPCTSLRRGRRLAACLALLSAPAAIAATPAPASVSLQSIVRDLAQPPARTDGSADRPVRVISPVVAPTISDPAGAVRGTMIMVHGGGWAGHSALGRDLLIKTPGAMLVQRGWRVVSIDHEEGTAGLQNVLDAVGAELKQPSGDAPLCIYGESSGAHLAIVAASRLRAVDCVIGLGTPTDLALYKTEAAASTDFRLHLVAGQISRFFGNTPEEMAPWEPVSSAPALRADVLLLREGDDALISPAHSERFQSARPTTQLVTLEAGDPADPSTSFVHGTASAAGRASYASAIGVFADRAIAARNAERNAARTGCPHVNDSIARSGLAALQTALNCLARNDARSSRRATGTWRRTSVNIRGELNAARIWAYLRATRSGRRALAAAATSRAKVIVHSGQRSRVTLRSTR